jgi:hypothetical protein
VKVAGYDDEGNGCAVLSDGERISIAGSRINDLLEIEVLASDGRSANGRIVSIKHRRQARLNDQPFDDSEMGQIENSMPRTRYRRSSKLGVFWASQTVVIPGVTGKQRMIFLKKSPNEKDYDAHLTNLDDDDIEDFLLAFYSRG